MELNDNELGRVAALALSSAAPGSTSGSVRNDRAAAVAASQAASARPSPPSHGANRRVVSTSNASSSATAMPPERLWKLADVAHHLGVAERTIRSWMVAHRLPHLKIGGTVRFRQADVAWWSEQSEELMGL